MYIYSVVWYMQTKTESLTSNPSPINVSHVYFMLNIYYPALVLCRLKKSKSFACFKLLITAKYNIYFIKRVIYLK